MKTNLLTMFFVSLLLFAFGASRALACSCVRSAPCQALAFSDAVFAGKIVSAANGKRGVRLHQVQISERFVGAANAKTVTVATSPNAPCGYSMSVGKSYLIYADRAGKSGVLTTGLCSRTSEMNSCRDDLDYLREWKKSGAKGAVLRGTISEYNQDFAAEPRKPKDVDRVFVENAAGEKFETAVQPDGSYQLPNLRAGRYKVFLKLPANLITREDAEDFYKYDPAGKTVRVHSRGCAVKNFEVKVNGEISGKVFDANGEPAANLSVTLLPIVEERDKPLESRFSDQETDAEREERFRRARLKFSSRSESKLTGADGSYSFKGLSARRYLLGVQIEKRYDQEPETIAYSPLYYPNAPRKEQAEPIELKPAETKSNVDFRLAPKLPKRRLAGRIVWQDNRPANSVHVQFFARSDETSRTDWTQEFTDATGAFAIYGYQNFRYLLKAVHKEYVAAKRAYVTLGSAKCFLIEASGEIAPVKLTLEPGANNCDETQFTDK